MERAAADLFHAALADVVVLTLPLVSAIAGIGVLVGIIQTIAQVQDQNVAFAPKLAGAAAIVAGAGPVALGLLVSLLTSAIGSLASVGR